MATTKRLTIEEIKARVRRIEEAKWDAEKAHSLEDELHRDVLTAIANGVCESPAAAARCAIMSHAIVFARHYV